MDISVGGIFLEMSLLEIFFSKCLYERITTDKMQSLKGKAFILLRIYGILKIYYPLTHFPFILKALYY